MGFEVRSRDPFWARVRQDFPLHYRKVRGAYEFGWASFGWRMATGALLVGLPPAGLALTVWAFEAPLLEWGQEPGGAISWLTPLFYSRLLVTMAALALALGFAGVLLGFLVGLGKKKDLLMEAESLELSLRHTLLLQMIFESEGAPGPAVEAAAQLNLPARDPGD